MDYRLRVFIAVAQTHSFTKAAQELYLSQPAVSRHIHELEEQYKVQLFERTAGKISLTLAGEKFYLEAERVLEQYKHLEQTMSQLSGRYKGELKIGASTSISHYILPPLLAQFISAYPDIRLSIRSGNSSEIEQALEEHRIDIGLVEGNYRTSKHRYIDFQEDELVLVGRVDSPIGEEIVLEELLGLPLLLRENGSGSLEVLENALTHHKIRRSQLNILLQLGSTESIKLFLENKEGVYSFISISALEKEFKQAKLRVIEIPELNLRRNFSIVLQQGEHHGFQNLFIPFLQQSKTAQSR